ncbi:MAG: undecaprenyl-diphosphate phosphatase [Minisyncoccia bacterium]
MISYLAAVILGVVEGFTEFLPISSTAHMILVSDILKITQSDFVKTFEIVIQSGAILAVVALYWEKFLDWELLKKIAAAFIPTGILGLVFYKLVKNYLLGDIAVILWSLSLGGILLIVFEKFFHERNEMANMKDISYGKAAIIGLFQSIAMIPGVSRAAATIVGGMLLGIRRELIVEFSFLLAVPTMLAATGLDLFKSSFAFSASQFGILSVGFIVSFIMAVISIKFLLNYIRRHSFAAFGYYRIVLVALFILLAVY